MNTEKQVKRYFELLVQNRQKGETYFIKFRGNPTVYSVIPIVDYAFKMDNDTKFIMHVLRPEKFKGVYKRSIEEIEFLEREGP